MSEAARTRGAEPVVRRRTTAGVATLTIDVLATRNALSAQVLSELRTGMAEAEADPSVRVLVISHTGPVFCSGIDLRAVSDVSAEEQPVNAFPALLTAIERSPLPVIARVGGKARAGGIGLLAACDLAIGSDDADFAFTEVRLGLVPAVISRPVLRRMQPQPARRYFLTGVTFDAARAVRAGLLDAAVPPQELDGTVERYVAHLRDGGPAAIAATKGLLAHSDERPGYRELSELSAAHFASAEGQEGTAARRERRSASWSVTDPH